VVEEITAHKGAGVKEQVQQLAAEWCGEGGSGRIRVSGRRGGGGEGCIVGVGCATGGVE
jgi:hypothetical protein